MTTKQHLRFVPSNVFGVVGSSTAHILSLDQKNSLFAVPACENVIVWNLQSKEKEAVFQGEGSYVTCLTSDQQSNVFVGYADGTVRAFNIQKQDCTISFIGHRSQVSCLAYDRVGANLASGGNDSEIVIWNSTDQGGLFRLKGHKGPVTMCHFHSGNVLVSSSKDTFIKFWDLSTQHCFYTLVGSRYEISNYALLRNSRIVVGLKSEIKMWDISINDTEDFKEQAVGTMDVAIDAIVSVSVDSTERLLAAYGFSKDLHLYKILNSSEISKRLRKKRKKESNLNACEESTASLHIKDEYKKLDIIFCPGKIVSVALNVDATDEAKITILLHNNCIVQYRMNLSQSDNGIQLHKSVMLPGHRAIVRTLSYSSDNASILSASDDCIKIWKRFKDDFSCTTTIDCDSALCSLFVCSDSHCIIGTKNGKLQIYDISARELLENISAHESHVKCIALSPGQEEVASGGSDKNVIFWTFILVKHSDYSEAKKRLSLIQNRVLKMPEEIVCIKYSPDRKKIVVSLLDYTVQVLFSDSLKLAFSLYGHSLPVTCLDLSYDSTLIATGSEDKDVRVWSMEFGCCNKLIKKAHDKGITCLRFLPKSHLFFTGSRDYCVKQWDADNFQKVITLKGHQSELTSMAVSQDGVTLVTSSRDKSIRTWEKTAEPVIQQEEREKELEELDKTTSELSLVPGELNKEVTFSAMKTNETVQTVDQLISAIQLYNQEAGKYEENKSMSEKNLQPHQPNVMFLAMNVSSPLEYMKKILMRVKSSDLEGALVDLPFDSALDLLRIIAKLSPMAPELCERCATLLIKIHFGQILSVKEFQPVIQKLKSGICDQLYYKRDAVGRARTTLDLLRRASEAGDEVSTFATGTLKKRRKNVTSSVISFV